MQGHHFDVIFIGQPRSQELSKEMIHPNEPIDLAIRYPESGEMIPIDMVNIVDFVGYTSDKGRLNAGLKSLPLFTGEIVAKVWQHLALIKDPSILVSHAGSKYATQELAKENVFLSIDKGGYLRVNGFRILTSNHTILEAASLRSHTLLAFKKHLKKNLIYLDSAADPAPSFYIELDTFVSLDSSSIKRIPQGQTKGALSYQKEGGGKYLKLSRGRIEVLSEK